MSVTGAVAARSTKVPAASALDDLFDRSAAATAGSGDVFDDGKDEDTLAAEEEELNRKEAEEVAREAKKAEERARSLAKQKEKLGQVLVYVVIHTVGNPANASLLEHYSLQVLCLLVAPSPLYAMCTS